MTEPQTQEISTIKPGRILALILFVAMASAIAYLYGTRNPSTEQAEELSSMRAELQNIKELNLQLKEAELYRERDQHVAESKLAVFRKRLDGASETITKLEAAIARWNRTTSDLMTSDQGDRLAQNSESVAQLEAILHEERPSEDLPSELRTELGPLVTFVEKAEKAEEKDSVSIDPGPTFSSELDSITSKAKPALEIYENHIRRLAALLSALPEAKTEGGPPLDEALQKREDERLQEENRLLAEKLEKARAENANKRAEDQVIAERRAGELEREKEQKKREQEELQRKAEIAGIDAENKQLGQDIAAALAKKKLEREYQQDLAQIKSLLSPFITEGRTQPEQGFFRQTTEVGPVSLGKLDSEGLLNVSIEDQRRLWYMASDQKRNGRALGSFPGYIGNATDWNAKQPTVQRAQALLIKYGELMVEKGMLAK